MQIPVYRIKVPEYRLKKPRKTSGKVDYALTPWFNIKVPKVYEDSKPDFAKIGAKIDKIIKKHFLGQCIVIRCISSQEHPGKTTEGLVKIIKKLGTDRYDPKRKGEKYGNVEGKHIDFFAIDFRISKKGEYMRQFVEPFYYALLESGGRSTRIDIAIIYDPAKLRRVLHRYEGRADIKRDGFVFKDPGNKPAAVNGIIKVL